MLEQSEARVNSSRTSNHTSMRTTCILYIFDNDVHQHGYVTGHDYGAPSHVLNHHSTVDDKPAEAIRQHSDHRATAGATSPATGVEPSSHDLFLAY